MSEEVDVVQFLNALEDNYTVFNGMFDFDPKSVLDLGNVCLQNVDVPEVNIPLSVLDYLKLR